LTAARITASTGPRAAACTKNSGRLADRYATQSPGTGPAAPTPLASRPAFTVPGGGSGWAVSSPLAWSQLMRRQDASAGAVGVRLPQAGDASMSTQLSPVR